MRSIRKRLSRCPSVSSHDSRRASKGFRRPSTTEAWVRARPRKRKTPGTMSKRKPRPTARPSRMEAIATKTVEASAGRMMAPKRSGCRSALAPKSDIHTVWNAISSVRLMQLAASPSTGAAEGSRPGACVSRTVRTDWTRAIGKTSESAFLTTSRERLRVSMGSRPADPRPSVPRCRHETHSDGSVDWHTPHAKEPHRVQVKVALTSGCTAHRLFVTRHSSG